MDSGGPKRILLDDFTITVSPTAYALTLAQAAEIKDVAEDLVAPYFGTYDWGDSTLYEYMGFTNIEAVSFYQTYSVIRIKGGIVSFDGSSQVIPSHVQVQRMIQELLDPTDGSQGLTEALQETQDFSYVVETIYDVLWEPTLSPTMEGTTVAPVAGPTENIVPIVSDKDIDTHKGASTEMSIPLLTGMVAAVLLLVTAAVLLVYRRRKSAAVWLKNANHIHPEEDDLESLTSKKALHVRDAAAISDAGSSRLGRLLSATAAAVHGGAVRNTGSEATPPQSSSEESEYDYVSEYDVEDAVVVEPTILPVHDHFEVAEQSNQVTILDQDNDRLEEREGVSNTAGSETDRLSKPEAFAATSLADTKGFDQWSDVSSNHSHDTTSDEDQHEFKPDESWDFNDNDDDSEAVVDDPFQTPNDVLPNDQKPLLGHKLEDDDEDARDMIDSRGPCNSNDDDDSDAVLVDPFQTPNTMPSNDETPLLRHLGTYKLEKILTSDSDRRRRSKSAPPRVRDRRLRRESKSDEESCEVIDANCNKDDDSDAGLAALLQTLSSKDKPRQQHIGKYKLRNILAGDWNERRRSKSVPSVKDRSAINRKPLLRNLLHDREESSEWTDATVMCKSNDHESDSTLKMHFQAPSSTPSNDEKSHLQHIGSCKLEQIPTSKLGKRGRSKSVPPDKDRSIVYRKPLFQNEWHDGEQPLYLSDATSSCNSSGDENSDATLTDPFQTYHTILSNDETSLLRRFGAYTLEKALTSDSDKRRRSKSAPPLVTNPSALDL
jgi:hypothetical protein